MDLDPQRYPHLRLADPSHKLPIPGTARFFAADDVGERVDVHDPYWALCVADGTLVPHAPPASSEPSA